MDINNNEFSCQICYEHFHINNKFNLLCCKALMCINCIEFLEDYRCPFCRKIIDVLKNDKKFISSSAPVYSFLNTILFSTNEVFRDKDRTRNRDKYKDIDRNKNKKYRSNSVDKIKAYHENNRRNIQQTIKDDIEFEIDFEFE